MAIINVLSPHVADMIAAGEVVERPASVIKELMENSLDAGARNLTVEIRGGGATYIRVSDDGCGMQPEDAGVAFLRHATSKLHDERGLEAIGTMGFRGEALAAVSAVSRIELRTRARGSGEGTRVTLEAGDIQEMGPCGCPEGTSMTVRDLFFNTPARLKFLKSDRSEGSACVQTALKVALGRPEVSVRMIKDGQEEFFTPGDGRMSSCIYTLLGRETASALLSLKAGDEGLSVTGCVSSPAAGRGSRAMQFFFCNGRYIKSPLLQAAVEQAYKNTLLTGRFPACVLYLDISFGSVDVNVHPAKTEVKFSQEKRVFDLVYQAVRLALDEERAGAEIELSPSTLKAAGLTAGANRSRSTAETNDSSTAQSRSPQSPASSPPVSHSATSNIKSSPGVYASSAAAPAQGFDKARPAGNESRAVPTGLRAPGGDFYRTMTAEEFRAGGYTAGKSAAKGASAQSSAEKHAAKGGKLPQNSPLFDNMRPSSAPAEPESSVENYVQNVETLPKADHKIVGEAMRTYIIAERDGELIFIDKHAAHERMIFDRLKAQKREIMSQQLLTPVPLRLTDAEAELIEQNGETLAELGFELEPYGERAYILRALPCDMDPGDAAAAVEEICAKLADGRGLDPASARDSILHTVACKAAVKAGWDTDERELERLVAAVLSGAVKYCPHGRPVSFTLTRRELERQFKRIV